MSGHRTMRLGRICQIGPAALQPALTQVMREIVAGAFEQLLKIALRDTFYLRDPRGRDIGIAELALDRLVNAIEQRRLRANAHHFGGAARPSGAQG